MPRRVSQLVSVTGSDAPGVAAAVFGALAALHVRILDVEQIEVHGQLLLCVEVEAEIADEGAGGVESAPISEHQLSQQVRDHLSAELERLPESGDQREVAVQPLAGGAGRRKEDQQLVTVLAPDLSPVALAGISGCIADNGGNVDRIVRLSSYPVISYELSVSGAAPAALRRGLGELAARHQVDLAVQRAGLHRRAKHMICLDADSTLLQGEVIDVLAARTGHVDQVTAITAAAMAGEIDFAHALSARVALLEGLGTDVLTEVAEGLVLSPGARTLIRTLKRLGYVTAVVSGGFVEILEELVSGLGIDHLAANRLEIVKGRLTGRLIGPVIDRAGKAEALARFAGMSGVPLAQTVAVGDGANDLDMLEAAGLGIAFNAKAVVQGAADASLNVPYLDAILFMLGISREEIEAADRSPSTAEEAWLTG